MPKNSYFIWTKLLTGRTWTHTSWALNEAMPQSQRSRLVYEIWKYGRHQRRKGDRGDPKCCDTLTSLYLWNVFMQNSDLASLGRRTGAIETLVGQLREAAEATNLPHLEEGKGDFIHPIHRPKKGSSKVTCLFIQLHQIHLSNSSVRQNKRKVGQHSDCK